MAIAETTTVDPPEVEIPLMNDVLSPEEQKLFRKMLNEAKRRTSDSKFLEQQAIEIRQNIIKAREEPGGERWPNNITKQLTLPDVFPVIQNNRMSGLSNWLAKTSIFAPRPPGPRNDTGIEYLELETPRGVTILFNGTELDMADQTLYLNLLKLAEGRGPNDLIYINRAHLLKLCGYTSLGTSSYRWLNDAFERLFQANLKIIINNAELKDGDRKAFTEQEVNSFEIVKGKRIKKAVFRLKMMGQLAEDTETGDYYFTMPPESLVLFANQMFGYNDLVKRLAIQRGRRGDLAAWLQSYICSDEPGEHHPLLVETLWRRSGSRGRVSDFFARLKTALDTCQKEEIIQSWKAYKSEKKEWLVVWTR